MVLLSIYLFIVEKLRRWKIIIDCLPKNLIGLKMRAERLNDCVVTTGGVVLSPFRIQVDVVTISLSRANVDVAREQSFK